MWDGRKEADVGVSVAKPPLVGAVNALHRGGSALRNGTHSRRFVSIQTRAWTSIEYHIYNSFLNV